MNSYACAKNQNEFKIKRYWRQKPTVVLSICPSTPTREIKLKPDDKLYFLLQRDLPSVIPYNV